VRVLCPASASVFQRRWCSPNLSAPEAGTSAAAPGEENQSGGQGQEAFRIHPKKVEASEAITESAEDGDSSSSAPTSSNAIIDAEKSGYDKFGIPKKDSVEWYAKIALKRDGRENQTQAVMWDNNLESSAMPIMIPKGLNTKNIYDHSADMPQHLRPLINYQSSQMRAHFEDGRNRPSTWKFLLQWLSLGAFVSGFIFCALMFRTWMGQPADLIAFRQEILQHSYGRVLELGAGSGSNIGIHPYPVTEVVMADNNQHQLQRLRYRLPKTSYPAYQVRLVDCSGQLPEFKDSEFDTVVDMFGLCHYSDPVSVLLQMQRVCKPTGTIILLEHGRSLWPGVSWALDWMSANHTAKTAGCQWNLAMEEIFQEAGLVIKEYRTAHFGTTKYVVAYPAPREDNMTSIVEEERKYSAGLQGAALAGDAAAA